MKHHVIYCIESVHGTLYFFVRSDRADREAHYLFAQHFRVSLWSRYRSGVRLDDALDRAKCSPADRKVCDKLFKAVAAVEKECGVTLFRRTERTSRPGKIGAARGVTAGLS